MLLPLKWLKSYVDISGISANDLAKKITLSGIEVERVYPMSKATNCVIGHVLEKTKHPQADKLSVCQVDLGSEVTQIVCGAQNVDKGQKVVVSKVGATLPGGVKIKKAKLRGEESNGMICSLKELGIENKFIPQEFQNGITVLDEKAPVGVDAIEYLGFNDTILELSLTPNRSDCLSMLGIAYEVSAIIDKDINKPYGEKIAYSINPNFKVKINSDDCPLYYAKTIKNVKIKRSPEWLQSALISCGIRPINNVVDVTNYVMLELGQPLHAFDFKKLNSDEIIVRNAFKNETIVTLDNIKRELLPTDLVITDGKKPIAIAGVMGGQNTEIDENTCDVVLESAVFNPLTVRKTYTRLGLRSESSIRFEKKVDPERTIYALNRACQLLVELVDAEIDDKLSVENNINDKINSIEIKLEKINRVLGITLSDEDVSLVFRKLKFDYKLSKGTFVVIIPSRRPDIMIAEDLIEEIIRIYGYDKLNKTLPQTNTVASLSENQLKIRKIKSVLLAQGLNEVMTYSLTNPKYFNRFSHHEVNSLLPVKLSMPISEERSFMRPGLIHSLVEVMSYNNARKNNNVFLFELGKRYYLNQGEPCENMVLAGACSGVIVENKWQKKKEVCDFYYVKAIIEQVFEKMSLDKQISFAQADKSVGADFHPSRSAYILYKNKEIGIIGQIHPNSQREYDINETYVFEIILDQVLDAKLEENKFKAISKYPTVTRDIAIVVDKDITVSTLSQAIASKGGRNLKSVQVFDVYNGKNVDKGKKSIAFSLMFENVERTLTDNDVNKIYDKVVKHLEDSFNAILRK